MGFFGKKKSQETIVDDCIKMIEKLIQKIGFDLSESRLPGEGFVGWWIGRGSALIYITINQNQAVPTVSIFSPILFLPEDNILPLYRRCLEINAGLICCALAVNGDQIAVVSERPIEGLDSEEFAGTLFYLSEIADDLDNKLADEFGATLVTEEFS